MEVNYKKCYDTCEHFYICKYVSRIRQIEEETEFLNTSDASEILVQTRFNCDHYSEAKQFKD